MALSTWIFLFAFFLTSPLLAEENSACSEFAWSLAREQALFKAADIKLVASGAALPAIPEGGFTLQLEPYDKANFALKPEREPRAGSAFAGVVTFSAVPQPGTYQFTISDEAWIDVIQDGQPLRSLGSTGKRNCPGLRKSVRFQLRPGPVVLQFSGVAPDKISVAILPAQ